MPAHALSTEEGLKDAARSTLREFLSISKRYRKARRRLDTLYLFYERVRTHGGHATVLPKATVQWDDRPEMELLVKHRDCYEQLDDDIRKCREAINCFSEETEPKTVLLCMQTLSRLELQRDRHLTDMVDILGQLSRELMSQENVILKTIAEGAKLSQMAVINREKIDAQMEISGAGLDEKSNDELLKIAKEYKQKIEDGEAFVIQDEGPDEQEVKPG